MATAELPPGNRKLVTRAPAAPPQEAPAAKKVERIAVGGVTRRKQPWYKNVKEQIFPSTEESILGYVAHEIVVPMIRNTLEDAIIGATQRALGSAGLQTSRLAGGGRRTNYRDQFSGGGIRTAPREMSQRGRATHNFDDIVLENRVDAEGIISALIAQIDDYGIATVAEMYEMCGVSAQFTDRNWGWDDLRGADTIRDRDGYRLKLPRPEPIK